MFRRRLYWIKTMKRGYIGYHRRVRPRDTLLGDTLRATGRYVTSVDVKGQEINDHVDL
jgi:hypothetical protein